MERKIAFIFPGQGSQKIGMGIDFAEKFPEARTVFEKASVRVEKDIFKICKEGPENILTDTRNTQPCIVTVSSAILEVLRKNFNLNPVLTAGHSVGEYSAMICSNILDFEDSVFLVNKRAHFMQQSADAYGKGSMAAVIGLEDQKVNEICNTYGETLVQPANFNSPGQVVISGDKTKITEIIPKFKEAGARMVKELSVSGPWHSRFMNQASLNLKNLIQEFEFRTPKIPYISNVTAKPVQSGDEQKDLLIRQLESPVLWTESINYMKESGVEAYIEIGPGKVLTGLIKRIDSQAKLFNIETVSDLQNLENFLES